MKDHHNRIANWLSETLDWRGVEFSRALSGGNSNLTWLFAGEGRAAVIRTTPDNAISPTSSRGIERESKVLRLLEGRVRAPGFIAWCDDLAIMGRPFLVQECVEGVSITSSLPAGYGDPVDATNRLGEDLVRQIAAVHAIEWPDESLLGLGRPDGFLQRQIERWLKIRREHYVRDLPLLFQLGEWLLEKQPPTVRPSFIHVDYHLDNTLADLHTPKINAIIDWELATVGDPQMDLSLALLFWGQKRFPDPPGFPQLQEISRHPGVCDRRHLANLWSATSNRSLDNMDYYMALAAWRLAAIIEGSFCLYTEGKVDSAYAAALKYNVPALLQEAQHAAQGDW